MKSTYDDFIGIYENIVGPSLCQQIIDLYENSDRWSRLPPANRTANYVQDAQLVIDCFNKEMTKGLMGDLKRCLHQYIDNYQHTTKFKNESLMSKKSTQKFRQIF